jgi:hypothetical protein
MSGPYTPYLQGPIPHTSYPVPCTLRTYLARELRTNVSGMAGWQGTKPYTLYPTCYTLETHLFFMTGT